MAGVSVGVVSDYTLWNVDSEADSILRASLELSKLEYLAEEYATQSSFQYSFWLLIGGIIIIIIIYVHVRMYVK